MDLFLCLGWRLNCSLETTVFGLKGVLHENNT